MDENQDSPQTIPPQVQNPPATPTTSPPGSPATTAPNSLTWIKRILIASLVIEIVTFASFSIGYVVYKLTNNAFLEGVFTKIYNTDPTSLSSAAFMPKFLIDSTGSLLVILASIYLIKRLSKKPSKIFGWLIIYSLYIVWHQLSFFFAGPILGVPLLILTLKNKRSLE